MEHVAWTKQINNNWSLLCNYIFFTQRLGQGDSTLVSFTHLHQKINIVKGPLRHEISHWKKHTTVTLSVAKFLNYTKHFKSRNIWNWLFTCFLVSEPTSCSPKCFGANLTSVTDVLLSTRELLFTWKKDSMLHFGDNARSVELGSLHAHQVSI